MMRKLLVLGALVFGGCLNPQDSTGVGNPGLTQTEQALVDDGDEGTKSGDLASSLVSIPMLAVKPVDSDDLKAATSAEAGTPGLFPGCVTATRSMSVVSFVFSSCTGRFGLSGLSGTMTATYSLKPTGALGIRVETMPGFGIDTLSRDGRPLRIDVTLTANAELSFAAALRKIVWNGDYLARVGAITVTHKPSYTASVDIDTQCVSLNGVATTNGDKPPFAVETTITGYVRCGPKNVCPNAGGKVTHTRLSDGAQLTIEFLGGTAARVTGPKRGTIVLPSLLKCSPG